VTGDVTQVDLPREQRSGLIVVGDVLEAIEGIEFVRFGGEDVVRHKLVQRIVEAYEVHSQREEAPARPVSAPQHAIEGAGSGAGASSELGARSARRA
jgi:phosphate starvation-inducible PhoH-like protein